MLRVNVLVSFVLAVALLATPTAAAMQPAQTQTLEVWTHEFPPLQDAMTNKWIPEFEASHPGVKVKMTAIPFAGVVSFDAKLLAALSSGSGPDFWDMGDWNYRTVLDNNYAAPLDPKIFGYASSTEMIDAYVPGTTDIFVRNGNLYGLFSESNTLALFYNLDMFDAAGIAPLPSDRPVSWSQIEEIGSKLRLTDDSGAPTQIGYQFGFFANFRSPQWYAQNFYEFMRQYGQNDLYVEGRPAAQTDAVRQSLQMIYDFTYTYQAYDPTFLSNWFADFPQNRVAMVLAGTWFVPAIRQNNPNVRFGVAPHPVLNPDDRSTYKNIQWSWGWSVNANKPANQQQLAQEFLAFMLGKNGESAQPAWWFSNLGYMQPSKAFLSSGAYTAKLATDPWLNQWVDAYSKYDIGYVQHSYDEAGAALVRAIDRVVYEQVTPDESARLLQGELERLSS
jgi:ABC-type glycerol-3-phosphate transport system substrate-binding protein